ncbi:unnamed protein product [Macrosiphum euphorbiae]|uniref:Uncharacterized protein n=1 Tax=Macrosiphum euphorbiae TaxID=13131 RepID=A0AAV0WFZ3_9HEMI|nr:unnamed protein product [Macrosiphum euphorbiae]
MSNNLNHNVPGYSGDDSPKISNDDSPKISNDDSPEISNDDNPDDIQIIPKPEVPFVSRYGMKHAKNSLQDVEFFRATLFNLKTEPIEDRERRLQETNSTFLTRCRDPNEICAYTEDPQPGQTDTEIKTEPIDEIEEDTSSLYMETEPFYYLPEEATENSSQIIAFNPRENELENNEIQQSREPEEEIDQQDNIPIMAPLAPILLEQAEINETDMMSLVVPEAIVLLNNTTETPSSTDTTTNPRASDLDNTNTSIIENPASVQRKTRKKRDVIATPTRVSTRIKKPRIMFNM